MVDGNVNAGIGNDNRRRGRENYNHNGGGRGGVFAVFLIVAVMFVLSDTGLRSDA